MPGEELKNCENIENFIDEAIESGLIYYDEQWELIKNYQTPKEANLSYALEYLYNDIYELLKKYF